MRFMLCAKDRASGTMRLVSHESFGSRRDAVEALSVVRDLSDLIGTDVYLVDLDTAVPVALVPCGAEGAVPDRPADVAASAEESALTFDEVVDEAAAEAVPAEDPAAVDELPEWATAEPGATLGVLQIDIDAWTCEDCIYVTTCAFSGTRRPSQCASFQWRA